VKYREGVDRAVPSPPIRCTSRHWQSGAGELTRELSRTTGGAASVTSCRQIRQPVFLGQGRRPWRGLAPVGPGDGHQPARGCTSRRVGPCTEWEQTAISAPSTWGSPGRRAGAALPRRPSRRAALCPPTCATASRRQGLWRPALPRGSRPPSNTPLRGKSSCLFQFELPPLGECQGPPKQCWRP
jgi:hypothetical protein